MVVTAVSSSFVAKAKSAMPNIRQATAGSADATPGGRTLIDSESPGVRPKAAARGRVTRNEPRIRSPLSKLSS